MARVMILIDGDNFSHMSMLLKQQGIILDVVKIRDYVAGDDKIYDCTMYISINPDNTYPIGMHGFVTRLRQQGIAVFTVPKRLKVDSETQQPTPVGYSDGLLFRHATRQLSYFDRLVLVSGDGIFQYLLEFLRFEQGKRVEVAGINPVMSAELLNFVQCYYNMAYEPMVSQIRREKPEPEVNE